MNYIEKLFRDYNYWLGEENIEIKKDAFIAGFEKAIHLASASVYCFLRDHGHPNPSDITDVIDQILRGNENGTKRN
jgi:hypothetical protein